MSISRFSYRISLSLVVAVGLAACLVAMALWETDAQAKKGATVPKEKAEPPRAEGCPAGGCRLFGPPTTYKAGAEPSFVATADLNKDGHADLLVVNSDNIDDGNAVYVLLGEGDGTFREAVGYRAPHGAEHAVMADFFFGDGNPDLILNDRTFYVSQGDGTLMGPGLVFGLNVDGRSSLTTADFNRDGKPDLAHTLRYDPLAIRDSDRVAVLWGTGGPEFEQKHSPWLYPGEAAVFVIAADFNGDGVPDLATANSLTDDVSILLANQDGTFPQDDSPFAPQPAVYSAGNSPDELAAADFTIPSDGMPDLVGTTDSDQVFFLENNGDGTFKKAVEIPAVQNARSPLAADFDGDKAPDLAVAYQNNVAVLLREGGTFQAPDSYEAGLNADSLATADFNEDGRPDLAVAFRGDGSLFPDGTNGGVSVLLNAAGTPPVGDAECDIAGTGGKDVLTGTSADETICGSGGMDTIEGGGGNDTLDGGNGKDTLDARDGTGGDTLIGGSAKDSCMGDADDTEQSC